jgi:hypothetical protein
MYYVERAMVRRMESDKVVILCKRNEAQHVGISGNMSKRKWLKIMLLAVYINERQKTP